MKDTHNLIILDKTCLLSDSSSSRICYVHPLDSNKIIKINRAERKGRSIDFNAQEYEAYQAMSDRLKTFFPKCYGYVDTNLGKGLVFERIIDYAEYEDKAKHFPPVLAELIKAHSPLLNKDLLDKLREFFALLEKEKICSNSLQIENIAVQTTKDCETRIISPDCKLTEHREFIPVCRVPFFLKMKIRRRGKRTLELVAKNIP